MTEKTEKELLVEISGKLDKIIAFLATSDIKDPKDKIPMLKNLGFTIEQTSVLTGLTLDVVKKERGKLKNKWLFYEVI